MKNLIALLISGALVVSGYAQTRNVLVGTNNAVVQPTSFWSADASNARAGLGLGSAATNPASAFQPSSTSLSNLAAGNGGSLTNITATIVGTNISITNVSGLQSALDGKLATNGSAANLTSFPTSVLQTNSSLSLFPEGLLRANGDGSGLTNLPVPALASNVLSTIAIEKGGTGATNASGARIALGGTAVGTNVFTAVDAPAARVALGLGTASISASTAFQSSSSILTNLANNNGGSLTNISAGNIVGTVGLASNITGTVALASNVSGIVGVANGGTGGTNESTARAGIGLGTTNSLTIAGVVAQNITIESGGGITLQAALSNAASFRTNIGLPWIGLTSADAPSFRTALGLGSAATNPSTVFQSSSLSLSNLSSGNGGALTNIAATSLVGIIPASNIASINFSNLGGTLSINSGGTSATNAANARQNLGSTTVGDAVFIATNSAAARTAIGSTTVGSSLFTLANPSAINFLRLNADNTVSALSATDFRAALSLGTASTNPSSAFQSSSSTLTNLSANNGINLTNILAANITGTVGLASNVTGTIAISNGGSGATTAGGARTNLGLGATWLTNTVAFSFRNAIGLGAGSEVRFSILDVDTIKSDFNTLFIQALAIESAQIIVKTNENAGFSGIFFDTPEIAASTRTNLGLGFQALTNTNSINFLAEILPAYSNNAGKFLSVNSNANGVVWTNISAATSPVTRIVAGSNVTISPTNGLGDVTINATGGTNGGGSGWDNLVNTSSASYILGLDTNTAGGSTIILPWMNDTNGEYVMTVPTNTIFMVPREISAGYTNTGNYIDIAGTGITFQGVAAENTRLNLKVPIKLGGIYSNSIVSDGNNLVVASNVIVLGYSNSTGLEAHNSIILGDINSVNTLRSIAIGYGHTISTNSLINAYDTIIGGYDHFSSGGYSTVIGGRNNTNEIGYTSTIVGGEENRIATNTINQGAAIVGGLGNIVSGGGAVSIGGISNTAIGNGTFVAGAFATATNNYSFVWSDGSVFSSTNTNSFNVKARGGMSLDLGSGGISFRNSNSANATIQNLLPSYSGNANRVLQVNTAEDGLEWVTSGGASTNSGIIWSSVPTTPTNAGTSGQVAYSSNYFYICVSNNNWRRVLMGTW